jgi:hypothetical protein
MESVAVSAAAAPHSPIFHIHGARPEEHVLGTPRPCGTSLLEARARAVEVARCGHRWPRELHVVALPLVELDELALLHCQSDGLLLRQSR